MAIIEPYTPAPVPVWIHREVRQYLDQELHRLADVLNREAVYLPVLAIEPSRPSDGMIVYADGAAWNPGSGAGFYGRESGTWVKL